MPKYLNVMWSADADFASVHNVHAQIAALFSDVEQCFLLGTPRAELDALFGRKNHYCEYFKSTVKGRGLKRILARYASRSFVRQFLIRNDTRLIVDGVGCLRFLGYALKSMPSVKGVVVFHGETRLTCADIELAASLATQLQFVAVSMALARSLEKQLGRPVMAIPSVVPQGVLHEPSDALQGLKLSPAFNYVGVVGRLVPGKGVDYLLEAWAQANMPPSYRLVYIGDGELRASLQARCEALALQQSVLFIGRVEKAAQWLRAFDWLVLPSLSEGQGLVVQEAVRAGVPVSCSELPVFTEQLGTAGVYFTAGDVKSLATVLRELPLMSAFNVAAQQRDVLRLEAQQEYFATSYREVIGS